MADKLVDKIKPYSSEFKGIYGIPRGGIPLASYLSKELKLPIVSKPGLNDLIVDDISDTGETLKKFSYKRIACLYSTRWTKTKPDWYVRIKQSQDEWISFPWESENELTEKNNK